MTGDDAETPVFNPNDYMTRGMLVTALYHIEGNPDVTGMQNIFNDVADNMWYSDALIWASANGIILGYGNNLFGPDDPVTREQLAAILARYADFLNISPPDLREYAGFNDDSDIALYAKNAVIQLYKAGIIEGKPENIFNPNESATRAEVAVVLRGFMEMTELALSHP